MRILSKSKSLIFKIIAVVTLIFITNSSYATHGMGMDLTYQCLGNNTYSFQLAFYRDCGGAAAPASASINFRSASCSRNFNRTLTFFSSGETTPVCASLTTECSGGAFPGAEEYLYRGTFTLPAQCNDWIISYSLCCRNNDINTINAPGSANIYTETTLNNTLATCNSSPSFSNDPVPFVCSNQPYCFNNGAIDNDGDSLVYTLVTPKTGPNPQDTVVFLPGFSDFNPITSSPGVSLDPLTGDLCMTPTDSSQIGVLAVLVEEYRKGVKIGSIRRDIQLRILDCPNGNSPPNVSGIDSTGAYSLKVCAGDTLDFNVYSFDADSGQTVTMSWNNAIPTASFNVSGGPKPVGNFVWSPANTEIRLNPYCFTVNVSDDNCPFEASQVFSYCIYVTGITSLVDSIDSPSCNSNCDGVGAVQIVNGTPPYTYQWNDPLLQTTAIANGLCEGVYSIVGTDSVGCTTTTNLAITAPDTLIAKPMVVSDYNGADISCFGFGDGEVSAMPIGGTPPYTFQWDAQTGNQISDTAVGLFSGTYSFTLIDARGCDTSGTITLSDPNPVAGIISVASDYNGRMISCPNASDGALKATGSGGTGVLSYLWSASAMSQTADTAFNLSAGSHQVTITDQNGCDTTIEGNLSDPPSISPSTTVISDYNGSQVSCYGSSDASAIVTAAGGTPGYTYQWDANTGFSTNDTVNNLSAGSYTVIVKDTNGCDVTDTLEVLETDSITVNITAKTNVYCNGQSTGSGRVSATGGSSPYSYTWSTTPVDNDSVVNGLSTGSYTVMVTDANGCNGDTLLTITESAPIQANINYNDLDCYGLSNGTAYSTPVGGNPPFTYRWTTNIGIQGSDTARNLNAQWHYLKITDAFNCTLTDSFEVNQPPQIVVSTSSNDTVCSGQAKSISASATGGQGGVYTFSWNNGLPAVASQIVNPDSTTLYIVAATDSAGCISDPEVITIFVRNFVEDSMDVTSLGNVCKGDTTSVQAFHKARFNNYTYVWNPLIGSDVGPFLVSPDTSKYYRLTINDQCGNSISDSVFVEVYRRPEISLPDTFAVGCNPLEVNFIDSLNNPNFSYSWSFGDNTSSIDPNPTKVYPNGGVYQVSLQVTSERGCTSNSIATSIVEVYSKPIVDFEANPISTTTQNPMISFDNLTTNATTYSWDFGDDSTSRIFSPTHTYADSGQYEVWLFAVNGKGCIDSSRLFVQIDPYFEIEIPNAFSPNPDFSSGGKYDPLALNNDVFFPHTTGVSEYLLQIFNRWGELIFESTKHEIGWDGYYKNELAQQEVYIYKLKIKWINGQTLNKVGDLTLFR